MKITFLGHASLAIQANDFNLLVDPFISGNPKASSISLEELKEIYQKLLQIDLGIKTGQLEPTLVLDQFVVEVGSH